MCTENEKLEMFLTQFSTCLAIVGRKWWTQLGKGKVCRSAGENWVCRAAFNFLLVILARPLGYASVAPLGGASRQSAARSQLIAARFILSTSIQLSVGAALINTFNSRVWMWVWVSGPRQVSGPVKSAPVTQLNTASALLISCSSAKHRKPTVDQKADALQKTPLENIFRNSENITNHIKFKNKLISELETSLIINIYDKIRDTLLGISLFNVS